MNDWFEPEPVDDRTPDMFDTYADPTERPTIPMTSSWAVVEAPTEPTSAVAAPVAPEPVADPYDAFAPVLGDVSSTFAHEWPESNGHDAGRNAPMLSAAPATEVQPADVPPRADVQAEWPQAEWEQSEWPQLPRVEDPVPVQPAAVQPHSLEGTGLGPTPSAELFEWDAEPEVQAQAQTEAQPDTYETPVQTEAFHEEMASDEWAPEYMAPSEVDDAPEETASSDVDATAEEVASADVQVTPNVTVSQLALPYSTTAPGAPTNLVVRIELSIVDDGRHVLTVTPDRELPTPRHPEFEPRAPRVLDPEPEPVSGAAWIEPADVPQATEAAPWDRPEATATPAEVAPWTKPAPSTDPAPWTEPEAQPEPAAQSDVAAQSEPAAPAPEPVSWAPTATSPADDFFAPPEWNVPHDPATPAPWQPTPAAQPQAQLSSTFAPSPTFEPASYANQPAAATQMPTAAAQPASAASIASDNDLWFLSTEPSEAEVAAAPAAAKEPSSLFTGALTVGMAVLVIFLVLVFIQLMTSLLR